VSVHAAAHGTHVTHGREGSCEIAIAGGGLVGMSLAVALGRAGIPVILVEASEARGQERSGYDARPIALSQGSRRILAALGVWDDLSATVTPISRIHVSDRGHFGFARLRAEDCGVDALGYVVAAADVTRALAAALVAMKQVRVLRPAKVEAVRCDEVSQAQLTIAALGDEPNTGLPSRVHAKLVVLCDGGHSPLREGLGIGVSARDYGQSAVTARVAPRAKHGGVAYERFTAAGPLALLPMHGNHCGLVWSTQADRAKQLLTLADADFLSALTDQFGTRLGGFVSSGPRSAFPLLLVNAEQVVGRRLAIIGNAANHLHPVAGQGLNLGLRDAAALAEIVSGCLREGGDPGDSSLLTRYAEGRRQDQMRVSRTTDALVRVFSSRHAPLVLARGLGLLAFDLLPPIKRRFSDHAMGLSGRQSRLARGLSL
jgi:2-octaprenyl-6-methoxyphenol hydroxylase